MFHKNKQIKNFKLNRVSSSIIVALIATSNSHFALADTPTEENKVEIISITGVRGSLQRSMDIKRESSGVVDAISAEDIGKMPDSNLAESLQRITGVSIDRVDGEGAKVTVRGFGADYNMITLNGRQMPAADVTSGSNGTGRAFNFANLASESVSGLEVYKTGKANVSTGGIGATINIKTARPLDDPEMKISVGAKALHDTTNEVGKDVTPEMSGIFSWANEEENFGIALSGSYQKRDSGSIYAYVNDWIIREWVPQGQPGAMDYFGTAPIVNQPAVGQLYGVPTNVGHNFTDSNRERTNGQLTIQYRPVDNLTLTVDHTYAENHIVENRGGMSLWFWQTPDRIEFDSGEPVATTTLYSDNLSGGTKDVSLGLGYTNQTNTLNSTGFNADWQLNENVTIKLDAHDSSMESRPSGPNGIGDMTFAMGAPIVAGQVVTYSKTGVPNANWTVNDALGNGNGILDKADIGSQISETFTNTQKTDITQIKLDVITEFDNGRLEFGVETRAMEMTQRYADTYNTMGDWGIANPGDIPADMYSLVCVPCLWKDSNPELNPGTAVRGDAIALTTWGAEAYGFNPGFGVNTQYSQNHSVKEDTSAVYFQLVLDGELGIMPVNLVTGLRYETTDVTSSSVLLQPNEIRWLQDNDFRVLLESGSSPYSQKSTYDYLLPNLDLSVEITDDLIARFSYSKTIARANYDQLRSTVSVDVPTGPTLLGAIPPASASNPGLLPLESNNFDVSLEWYYDKSSYVSVGFFEKRVNNFIGTEQVEETQFDLRDPTAGPRAQAARAALQANGIDVNQQTLFVMTAILDNPADFPGGAADFPTDTNAQNAIQANYDISPNSSDPAFRFMTSKPINNESAKIYGIEIAGQHFFGDSGFGIQANYTIVRGDVGIDDTAPPSESQFALVGLSDTANFGLIYENYGVSARLVYNWRDKFLSATSVGSYRSPQYTEEYAQVDFTISYDVTDNVSVSFNAINLTGENLRIHGRSERQLFREYEFGPRYDLGVRYTF